MKNLTLYLFLVFSFLSLVSCVKEPKEAKEDAPNIAPKQMVFIINEGNFQWGNSSISSYNIETGAVTQNIFQTVNNRPLGDVAQSALIFENLLYVVVNNSGKIEVLNPKDFKSVNTFTGFTSPRYILPIDNEKAYVTDLYAKKVSIIQLQTGSIISEIKINAWTEQMVLNGTNLYISSVNKPYLYIVDSQTDLLKDSIDVHFGGYQLTAYKNHMVLMCSGSQSNSQLAALYVFNFDNLGEPKILEFPQNRFPSNISIHNISGDIYWNEAGKIFKSNISETTLPNTPFLEISNSTIYGLKVFEEKGWIFVADAKDYVSQGSILLYSLEGQLIKEFKAGVIPSKFIFY
jgi:hypothetical protein